MKKTVLFFSVFLFLGFMFSSCGEEPQADPRDQYVGTWSMVAVGSASLYYDGQVIGTMPYDEKEDNVKITKSGSNELDIDGMIYTLSGSKLTAPTLSETENDAETGISIVGTQTFSGNASLGLIVINSNITGSWSGQGMSGVLSGKATYTFTKK